MATTLTSEFGGKVAGPVYNPAVVIEPSVEFPPVTQPVGITMFGAFETPVAIACGAASQTSQVTSVFCMPTTEALNCCVPVRTTVVCPTGCPKLDPVLIVSLTGDEEPLPHPASAAASTNTPAILNFIRSPSVNLRARAFRTPSLAYSLTKVRRVLNLLSSESPAHCEAERASRLYKPGGESLHLLIQYAIQCRHHLRLQNPGGQRCNLRGAQEIGTALPRDCCIQARGIVRVIEPEWCTNNRQKDNEFHTARNARLEIRPRYHAQLLRNVRIREKRIGKFGI